VTLAGTAAFRCDIEWMQPKNSFDLLQTQNDIAEGRRRGSYRCVERPMHNQAL